MLEQALSATGPDGPMSDVPAKIDDACGLCGEQVILRVGRDGGTLAISTWKCPRCSAVQPVLVAATILSVESRYPTSQSDDGSGD